MYAHASMNRIYRLVWSERLGAMVAVAENCAGHGKRSGGVVGAVIGSTLFVLGLGLGIAHADNLPAPAALPSGGKIVAGQAAISQSGARMDISQSSKRAVIDWQSFHIGSQAEVRFSQPDRQSVALNRVLGNDPSAIHGKLNANGQVFLLNPNGVLFGPNAKVDVGGLVATSMRLTNDDFMAGRYDFKRDGKGSVQNQGELKAADGGYLALLAPEVRNEGVLSAKLGTVALAAGDAATLEIGAEGRLSVKLDPGTVNTLIENRHMIVAEGGNVILSAGAALRLREGAIPASGTATSLRIHADGSATLTAAEPPMATVLQSGTVQAEGGRIDIHGRYVGLNGELDASGGKGGNISVTAHNLDLWGKVDAQGKLAEGGHINLDAASSVMQTSGSRIVATGATDGGGIQLRAAQSGEGSAILSGRWAAEGGKGRGGQVDITGKSLSLLAARVSADGMSGGGRIRIGGEYQGAKQDLKNARTTTLNSATSLSARAIGEGEGGQVVVWSDEKTLFSGRIDARGGEQGGDGGLVEVSGKQLGFWGKVDASAVKGRSGSLLLDPKNIVVDDNAGTGTGMSTITVLDPNETVSGTFGLNTSQITILDNGNIVVRKNKDNFAATDAGAVYLIDGATGAVISTLRGSAFGDAVGSSLVVLANGNYVVGSYSWDNGTVSDAGAISWGSKVTGLNGTVSSANSLVGSSAGDLIGKDAIFALSNGNYVVASPTWDNGTTPNVGAVTWGSGTAGVTGAVSSDNSLIGSTTGDRIGSPFTSGSTTFPAVYSLANGNYVIASPSWSNNTIVEAGGVTWANGETGITGMISSSNSLIGSQAQDALGSGGIRALGLSNGNYVINSPAWHNGTVANAGAVTWGNGTTGMTGIISSGNSLVGLQSFDLATGGITALSNGNYVVQSPLWSNGTIVNTGAITWADGTTGVTGMVNSINSLIGSQAGDSLGSGGILSLSNGNYVISSPFWDDNSIINAGAATWGSRIGGISGLVSSSNSLVGSKANDKVGTSGVFSLKNGNYLVRSPSWGDGTVSQVGAITWGDGAVGTKGIVTSANSLVGSKANDFQSTLNRASTKHIDVIELTNGNFVISTPDWDNGTVVDAGAVTWGSGTAGVSGVISSLSSLVGSTASDKVGATIVPTVNSVEVPVAGVVPLANGNYVVKSPNWDNGSASDAGAATWGSGTSGISGTISSDNSLVGSTASDRVGFHYVGGTTLFNGIIPLTNGNYVVTTRDWNNGTLADAGAVTWANGASGISGTIHSNNSLIGTTAGDKIGERGVIEVANGNYVVSSSSWNNGTIADVGAVTWGNGTAGVSGVVNSANSLIGSVTSDSLGSGGVTVLADGSYVFRSSIWDNGSITNAGAVTWASGSESSSGTISSANSLMGSNANDFFGSAGVLPLSSKKFLVLSPNWDNPASGRTDAGRIDLVTPDVVQAPAGSISDAIFSTTPGSDLGLSTASITSALSTGTALTLQANNDITINSAITASNPSGTGGAFSLQAGRSILINASIQTGNGDLTLIANDKLANGVVDAHRDAGAAVVAMASGTQLNAGSGNVLVELRDGAGKTHAESGSISLRDVTGQTITVRNQGPTAGSGIVLDGTLNAAASSGNAIEIVGKTFINHAGANALQTSGGRYLVWSADPASDDRGGLASQFKQYNAAYGATPLGSGNGFLYELAPVLSASLTGTASKQYDGGTAINLANSNFALSGAVDGDTVSLSSSGATLSSKQVGSGKTVSASGLQIAGGTNGTTTVYGYALNTTSASGNIGEVTPVTVTASISAADKVYDGTTAATLTPGSLSGVVGGDAVSLSGGTASFSDKKAGTNKPVTYSGLSLTGADADNYELSVTGGSTTASIGKATLTPAVSAESRVYDGKASAVLKFGPLAIIGNDVVTLVGGTGSFNNKNAGTGKPVTYSGLILTGADATNYMLSSSSGTTNADITRATLTVGSIGANNRSYDGTTSALLNYGLPVGMKSGDSVTLTGGIANFSDKNAGTGKPVLYSGLTLAGTDAGNYVLAATSGTTTGDITKRNVTPRLNAITRIYDGTTAVNFTRLLNNAIAGDSVTLNVGTASFNDKNAGTGKSVTYSGLSLSGADAANYNMSQTTVTGTGTINKANLTPVVVASDKIYDGGISAVVSGTLSGIIGGDTVNLSIGTASFDTSSVGTGKPVTYSGLSLGGTDGGNYALTKTSGTATASILPVASSASPAPTSSSGMTIDGGMLQSVSVKELTATSTSTGIISGSSGQFGMTLPESEQPAILITDDAQVEQ